MNLRHENTEAERQAIQELVAWHREQILHHRKKIVKYLAALKAIDEGTYNYRDYFGY